MIPMANCEENGHITRTLVNIDRFTARTDPCKYNLRFKLELSREGP